MDAANQPVWLSINDLCARWSCGRSTVYRKLKEMEQGGYLRRFFLGKTDVRVNVESVETWERLHSAPDGEDTKAVVVKAREKNEAPKRRPVLAATKGADDLDEWWKARKAAKKKADAA